MHTKTNNAYVTETAKDHLSKKLSMPRYRKYSWQVAPQQSPLPLFSGKTNIGKICIEIKDTKGFKSALVKAFKRTGERIS